jgi:hypothetical protein
MKLAVNYSINAPHEGQKKRQGTLSILTVSVTILHQINVTLFYAKFIFKSYKFLHNI